RAPYLTPLLRGERLWAYARTEPQAASELRGVATRVTRSGDGWQLDGEKVFVHNAPVASFAAVLARTGKGMSVFLVDLDLPGITRTYREHKMGQRASQVGGLRFEAVRLPGGALLGEEGAGFR